MSTSDGDQMMGAGDRDRTAMGGARSPLRLGTRGSALALAQSGHVADALRALGVQVELLTIRTAGDDRPPDATWGEGAFVGALETALLEGRVDLAVHSAKDVPTLEDHRLTIAAFPPREDPRDALVGRQPGLTLEALPAGARVGTDSPRRSAFLRAARPDLVVHPLHGNVDTRLRRLDAGETDALVLAAAGLRRLGRAERIGQLLPPDVVPPAPGQGALAIQCRAGDASTIGWVSRLDDPATRAAVEAERAFLAATGGGCRAPIGALGTVTGDDLRLVGGAADPAAPSHPGASPPAIAWDGVRGPSSGRLELAARLASALTGQLAAASASRAAHGPRSGAATLHDGRRVLVTRPEAQSGPLAAALARAGFSPTVIPTIEIRAVQPDGELDEALRSWDGSGWIAVTSANGAAAVLDAARRLDVRLSSASWAAVGDATREALESRGIPISFTPSVADGERLAAELPLEPGTAVLLPRADLADRRVVDRLEERGARVTAVVAYRTALDPAGSREHLRAYFASAAPEAIIFTSGSTVLGLVGLLGTAHRAVARGTLACCIGARTAAVARAEGFDRVVTSQSPQPDALAQLLASVLPDSQEVS